jgi:tRNA (cmo5U34)-methyltransferase
MDNVIRSRFNEVAKRYDQQRRKLIPCFDDFYGTAVSIIDCSSQSPEVLDIGAGTGLFSSFMLERYPDASLTLIDLSENMLDIARERFKDNSKVKYIAEDYLDYTFDGSFDAVISALSIHHHSDREKRRLYSKCYTLLKEDGIFVSADQVRGDTPYLESLNRNDWRGKIERSGLSRSELDCAYERIKLDKMSPLADQIDWLKESGFSDVDCVYKYYSFVVLFGRKRTAK